MQKAILYRKIGITVAIVLLGGLMIGRLASAAGPVCSVPGDYATIQEAVNDVGCTTVNVAAGTYAEHVTVNRNVVLNGANVGVSGTSTRAAESIIIGLSTGALQITADDVTIDGFKIESPLNDLGTGVHIASTNSGYLIKNNLITGNQMGIYANSDATSTISYNLFDANNEPGASGGTAIYSEMTNGLIVDNNEFTGHTLNNPVIFAAVAPYLGAHLNLVFSNNVLDNEFGIYALGIDAGSFTGNDIDTNEATALALDSSNRNITVTGNLIHDNARGVRVRNDFGAASSSSIMVNRNSFTGNSEYGVGNISGYTGDLNAECNWWGAVDGPGSVGLGTGDGVTTLVDFTPWLTGSDLENSPCDGPLPPPPPPLTEKDQCKDGGWMEHGFKNQGQCVRFVETGKDSR